jgi:hypothetical protein
MSKKKTSSESIREINSKYNDPTSPRYMQSIWRENAIKAIIKNVEAKTTT